MAQSPFASVGPSKYSQDEVAQAVSRISGASGEVKFFGNRPALKNVTLPLFSLTHEGAVPQWLVSRLLAPVLGEDRLQSNHTTAWDYIPETRTFYLGWYQATGADQTVTGWILMKIVGREQDNGQTMGWETSIATDSWRNRKGATYSSLASASRKDLDSGDSPYTLTIFDRFLIVDTTAAAVTINLLAAASFPNTASLTIIHAAGGVNPVNVVPNGAETINGVSPYPLPLLYNSITIVPGTGVWYIV